MNYFPQKTYPQPNPSQNFSEERGQAAGTLDRFQRGQSQREYITRKRGPGSRGGPKPRAPSCATSWASNPGNSYVKSSNYHLLLISSAGSQKDGRFRARTHSSPVREALWPGAQSPGNCQEPSSSCVVPRHRTTLGPGLLVYFLPASVPWPSSLCSTKLWQRRETHL